MAKDNSSDTDQYNPKVKVVFADRSNDFSYGNDSDSASGETNNTGTTSDMTGTHANHGATGLAREERWVILSRWLVFSVMVAAATLVGVETFRISTKQQEDNFVNDVSFQIDLFSAEPRINFSSSIPSSTAHSVLFNS